mgnify:FL=1
MFPHNNEGYHELVSTYDTECMQEIANHGCKSGVCSEHIYYGDTITFFDKYEAEILDLIHIRYGSDTLVDIFKQHDACYDAYRNDCCWLFIENVAQDVIQTLENEQLSEDEMIESYMQPVDNYTSDLFNGELQQSAEDLMNLSVYNPPNSMTLNRYSQS